MAISSKLTKRLDAGLLRAGVWLESSDTERHTFDLDWTLNVPNPKEATAPKDVSYNQNSSWKQYQPFVEFEWAVAPQWTVTPGVKYVHFKRSLDAVVNQGTRIPTTADQTYTTTLPFLTANHAINKEWSAYAQVARGFLVPDLSMFYVNNPNLSTPKPQTSTNYQLGTVHQSGNLTFDADVYYIDFNNKIASTGTGNDLVYYNQGGVVYKGIEGAATWYVGSGFSLHANGSINKAEAKDSGLQIAKVPKSTAALGLLYKDHGLYGSLIAKSNGSQYAKDGEPAAYQIGAYTGDRLHGRLPLARRRRHRQGAEGAGGRQQRFQQAGCDIRSPPTARVRRSISTPSFRRAAGPCRSTPTSKERRMHISTMLRRAAFGAALVLSQGAVLAAASDPVVMSFATVGDSRADPATAETAQDKVYLQNTRALSRILREIQAARPKALFFNGDMIMGYTADKAVIGRQYAYWRGMTAGLMESGTYVVPVTGNHEMQFQGQGRRRQDHQDRASRKRRAVARKHGRPDTGHGALGRPSPASRRPRSTQTTRHPSMDLTATAPASRS